MKVGFIGTGNMGGAVAAAVAKVADSELYLSNHNAAQAQALKVKIGQGILASNVQIAQECDVVFIGVKPYLVEPVLTDLASAIDKNPDSLWISMAAGVTLKQLKPHFKSQGLIRMMPNTPVAVGQGVITYSIAESFRKEVDRKIFEHHLVEAGTMQLMLERQLDAATALAGCGPAFVYQFIEALADAGVQNGLSRADSLALAAQTVSGAARMVLETDTHPAVLKDQVCSPGGSTIAGVVALEDKGFRAATISAVQAAYQRTQELGE